MADKGLKHTAQKTTESLCDIQIKVLKYVFYSPNLWREMKRQATATKQHSSEKICGEEWAKIPTAL